MILSCVVLIFLFHNPYTARLLFCAAIVLYGFLSFINLPSTPALTDESNTELM